jgi:hypothetical protein
MNDRKALMTAAYQEPEEVPRPTIIRRCRVCDVSANHLNELREVVVSPTGTAHHSSERDPGDTACGKDATGDGWWWPL